MYPILQNKFLRFFGVGLLLVVGIIIFWIAANLFSSSMGLGNVTYYNSNKEAYVPSVSMRNFAEIELLHEQEVSSDSIHYPSQPDAGNYTSDLETYETTLYSVTGRTKQFDELCGIIKNLKSDLGIHFKSLSESTNSCRSTFYVNEDQSDTVLNTLTQFKGVEYKRNTYSVTRHRQQLQGQTGILQQQLSNVQRSLSTAETQLNNLNNIYLTSEDVATLSLRVNESLRLIDQLTQRKINLTGQLNNLYQKAADLEQRFGVAEFTVNINRSNPIYANEDSQKWESAWDNLSDTLTDTLIGLSVFFGIFLLWTLRLAIYVIVLLIVIKGIWKLIKFLWSK